MCTGYHAFVPGGRAVALRRRLGLYVGIFVIVADMIGTGIFMTTGNVPGMTKSAPLVLALRGIGGLVAIAGALCMMPVALLIWTKTSCCAVTVVLPGIRCALSGIGSPENGIVAARRRSYHEGP